MSEEITKRDVVEAFLSDLCEKLDKAVLTDNEEWEEGFKNLVHLVHVELGLTGTMGTGFYYYFPDDEDVEILYPIIASIP